MAKKKTSKRKLTTPPAAKSNTLTASPLRMSIATPNRNARQLNKLVNEMNADIKKQIIRLFENDGAVFFAQDAGIATALNSLMKRLQSKYVAMFEKIAIPFAMTMVEEQDKASQSVLKKSMESLVDGLTVSTKLYSGRMADVLQAAVNQAADLIVSIPKQHIDRVRIPITNLIANPNNTGLNGAIRQVNTICAQHGKQTRNRAKLLVMDQTRKVFSTINAERMQALGVTSYRWVHTGGSQKPRDHHKYELNGQVFRFDDPPIIEPRTGERGIPGQSINCRCQMSPILEFSD